MEHPLKMAAALKALHKAEAAARKAQDARDAAEKRWNAAMKILRGDDWKQAPSQFWLDHCEKSGSHPNSDFGDILC